MERYISVYVSNSHKVAIALLLVRQSSFVFVPFVSHLHR